MINLSNSGMHWEIDQGKWVPNTQTTVGGKRKKRTIKRNKKRSSKKHTKQKKHKRTRKNKNKKRRATRRK